MKLQAKLTGAFGFLAVITLALALLALWQVQRLGTALFEVGAVRLPGIRGLSQMHVAMHELEHSAHRLVAANGRRSLAAERTQQYRSWQNFESGWRLYAAVPQGAAEAEKWRAFVPIAQAWRQEYTEVLHAIGGAVEADDPARITAARARLATAADAALAPANAALSSLIKLNYRAADETRQRTIATQRDMERTGNVMLIAAIVSVVSAIGFGLALGRRLSRPVVELAAAFSRVSRGDRQVKVSPQGNDEVARMGEALNQMVDALRVNESRLQLLADRLPDSVIYQVAREPDGAMRFLHVSAGVELLHGVTAAAVLADATVLYGQVVEEDRAALADAEAASFAAMAVFHAEVRIRRPDGAVRWMMISSQPRREAESGRVVWDGFEVDITERKRSGAEAQRANRALRALSHTNHALVHATDELGFLREVCRIIVEDGGYRLAWVGYPEHDEHRSVRPVAHHGTHTTSDYVATLKITWADEPRGHGPTGVAIRTGQPAFSSDFGADPKVAPWREAALQQGLVSSYVFPLTVEGTVVAAVAIYSSDPEAFDANEVALLRELADDMAYGLQTLRARERQAKAEAEVRRLLAEAEHVRRTLLSLLEDRQQAMEAMRLSEERFRSAMHHSGIGMALVSTDGRWLEVNPALCRIVGYSRDEMLQRDFQSITHPDDRPRDHERVRALLAGAIGAAHFEKRYVHRAGHIVWIELTVSLLRDPARAPLYFVSQMQDITARKQAEASLEAAAERLALALRASRFGVWRHHLQNQNSEWDARMFEIFGLPVASSAPPLESILAQVADEDREAVRRSWHALPSCDRNYHIRFRVVRADRSVRHIELQGIVHDDDLGRPGWSIGVAGDITEIVSATAESERLRAQLQQAQKMETLGKLAAGVAHDFNNLLTGINGFVELASTSLGPGHEAADLLKQARRGALSARDLVRRILNFSRSSRDQKRTHVNVVEVVRDTAPLIAAAMPANVSLSLAISCDSAPVLADSGQLQQVLMNLCTNGAHAIGAKAGRIQIGVGVVDLAASGGMALPPGCAPGRYVRLAVRDSGCGMDEATRQRIFEPFFTTKHAGEGTGLGLAIVHDIVTAHEGGLEVSSTVGGGSTFAIYLPLTSADAVRVETAFAGPAAMGRGQRVMVVDDEPSVATVVRLTLQKHGFEPEVFTSPNAAWARFESNPARFELLIVDQNMPELTGPELVTRVRQLAPDLPIIMMSGRFENAVEANFLHAARVAPLKKPFELVEVVVAARAALAPAKRGG
ncbi:MAG: PAS domain S-box protein [Verrucomicrobia bacterium]|nr:PAS domain S-box protein [Verrucomicrobiota bacterium]